MLQLDTSAVSLGALIYKPFAAFQGNAATPPSPRSQRMPALAFMAAKPHYTLAGFGAWFLSFLLLWFVILKASSGVALWPRFLGREKESHSALTQAGSPRNLCKSPLAWKTYGPSTKELS